MSSRMLTLLVLIYCSTFLPAASASASTTVLPPVSEDFWSKLVKVFKEGAPMVSAAVKEFGPELESEISNSTKAYINSTVSIRIDQLEKEVKTTHDDLGELKSGITNVQSQVTGVRVDLADLKSDVRELSKSTKEWQTTFEKSTKEWDAKLNFTVSDIDVKTGHLMLGLAAVKEDVAQMNNSLIAEFKFIIENMVKQNNQLGYIMEWIQNHTKVEQSGGGRQLTSNEIIRRRA